MGIDALTDGDQRLAEAEADLRELGHPDPEGGVGLLLSQYLRATGRLPGCRENAARAAALVEIHPWLPNLAAHSKAVAIARAAQERYCAEGQDPGFLDFNRPVLRALRAVDALPRRALSRRPPARRPRPRGRRRQRTRIGARGDPDEPDPPLGGVCGLLSLLSRGAS